MGKYITAEQAVQVVMSGNRVFIHGSSATPVHLIKALQNRYRELENVEFVSITNLGDVDLNQPEYRDKFFSILCSFLQIQDRWPTVAMEIMCLFF